jgi:hypothetical protein
MVQFIRVSGKKKNLMEREGINHLMEVSMKDTLRMEYRMDKES